MTFDLASFRAENVTLLPMTSYQRALYQADKAEAARKAEPQWQITYAEECFGRSVVDRPTENEVCEWLYEEYCQYRRQLVKQRLHTAQPVELEDMIDTFGFHTMLVLIREVLHDARQEADLKRLKAARGETVQWMELSRGKVEAVVIPLPT